MLQYRYFLSLINKSLSFYPFFVFLFFFFFLNSTPIQSRTGNTAHDHLQQSYRITLSTVWVSLVNLMRVICRTPVSRVRLVDNGCDVRALSRACMYNVGTTRRGVATATHRRHHRAHPEIEKGQPSFARRALLFVNLSARL